MRSADESFACHQAAVARWAGYDSAARLNAEHDRFHEALCRWLGIVSHSMLCAAGEPHDPLLAAVEEDAALFGQRLMAHHKVGVPE